MSELDLAAIRARCDAATPGPWWASAPLAASAETAYAVCRDSGDPEGVIIVITLGDADYGLRIDATNREADTEFVAHARADVPALLGLVDELRAHCDGRAGALRILSQQYEEARAEADRLRTNLAADASRLANALALHPRIREGDSFWCGGCSLAWPCPTVRALSDDPDGGGDG